MKPVHAAAQTDTGRKRRRNEDAFVCEPPLFAVADGMGGAQAGEVASQLAAAALQGRAGARRRRRGARRRADPGGEPPRLPARDAGRRRFRDGHDDDASRSSSDGRVAFGHVGDSRAYLLRDGKLEQLTEDHSLVAELVRRGKLSPEEAETPPAALGDHARARHRPRRRRRHVPVDARPGDVFLLCSDGLTDDGRRRRRSERGRAHRERPRRRPRRRSSARRTRAAARTTSPSSSSRSAARPTSSTR